MNYNMKALRSNHFKRVRNLDKNDVRYICPYCNEYFRWIETFRKHKINCNIKK